MTTSRRFLSPILGLLLAGALTLYMNVPSFAAFLTIPGYSTLHMGNIEEDRAYYLSRIKEASEGHWLIGNSALYEHRFDVSPNGFIETVTAAFMRVTGLKLNGAVLLTNVLFPFLILALTYLWMERILRSKLLALTALITVWFAVFGTTGLLRESSPKVTMLLPSLYLTILFCMEEGRAQKVLRGVLIGLMMYSYHYHWTLLFVFEGLLLLHALIIERRTFREMVLQGAWIWVPLLLIALPYGGRLLTLQGNMVAAEAWRRFGMIGTHLPTAPLLQFTTVSWIAALGTLHLTGLLRGKQSLLLLLLLIAGFLAVNSNIITGREAEFEGHYGRVIRLFTWTALFLCMGTFLPSVWKRWIIVGLTAIIGLHAAVSLPMLVNRAIDDHRIWKASGKQQVFDWLASSTPKDSVILAPFSVSSLVPVLTDDYSFMNYAARSFFVSDQELLERYLVQITFFPQDKEPIDTGVQPVFGNFPGSTYSKNKRIHQLLTLFHVPFSATIADFIPDQNKRRLLENFYSTPDSRLVAKALTKYRLDYLVTPYDFPPSLQRSFTKLARVGTYWIYVPNWRNQTARSNSS